MAGPLEKDKVDIYDPRYVKDVFDKCSDRYITFSYIFSFGFTERWRKQCVAHIPPQDWEALTCYDLMSGTGETWPWLFKKYKDKITITAVDISDGMHIRALARMKDMPQRVSFLRDDIFNTQLPENSADIIIATFGLKTFNPDQQTELARVISRALKPGGSFSLVEASDPKGWVLRPLYMFHLKRVLPVIERFFLRGAQDFSMIGQYTTRFQNCDYFAAQLRTQGLDVTDMQLMFGCATGVCGTKPA